MPRLAVVAIVLSLMFGCDRLSQKPPSTSAKLPAPKVAEKPATTKRPVDEPVKPVVPAREPERSKPLPKSAAEIAEEKKREIDASEAARLADLEDEFKLLPAKERKSIEDIRKKLETWTKESDFGYGEFRLMIQRFRFFHVAMASAVVVANAEKMNVSRYLSLMKITDESQVEIVKMEFGVLHSNEAGVAILVAEKIKSYGLESVSEDAGMLMFVKSHDRLFFPKKHVK